MVKKIVRETSYYRPVYEKIVEWETVDGKVFKSERAAKAHENKHSGRIKFESLPRFCQPVELPIDADTWVKLINQADIDYVKGLNNVEVFGTLSIGCVVHIDHEPAGDWSNGWNKVYTIDFVKYELQTLFLAVEAFSTTIDLTNQS